MMDRHGDLDRLLEPVELSALDHNDRTIALYRLCEHVMDDYAKHGRRFPWRETTDPYHVLLSEMMLQQTQTGRVLPKYQSFVTRWPDLHALAQAQLVDVLSEWRGLGYNRRALALKEIALRSEAWGWNLPSDEAALRTLPMVGPATAAALTAFCHNQVAVYLETNVRRVLIHQCFPTSTDVPDSALRPILLELAVLQDDIRSWYYALMDYGVYLKGVLPNPNRRSRHYAKQTTFANSNRQIRGMLLTAFTEQGPLSRRRLYDQLPFEPERIDACLQALAEEGFIACRSTDAAVAEQDIRYGIADER